MYPPQKKRQKEWSLRNDCLKKKTNNPNTGLWVELLVYLLDHGLIERLLVWCVTVVITFLPCHCRYPTRPKKREINKNRGFLKGVFQILEISYDQCSFFFLRGNLQIFCRQINVLLKFMGPDTRNFRPTLDPRTFAISLRTIKPCCLSRWISLYGFMFYIDFAIQYSHY